MTDVQYMREIENLEARNTALDKALNEEYRRNKKLSESLTACKIEVNKYGTIMDQAAEEIERLRMALEDIAYPNPLHNEDNLMGIARAALEGK